MTWYATDIHTIMHLSIPGKVPSKHVAKAAISTIVRYASSSRIRVVVPIVPSFSALCQGLFGCLDALVCSSENIFVYTVLNNQPCD